MVVNPSRILHFFLYFPGFVRTMILFQSRGPWYLKTNFPVSGRGEEESELQCGELVPNFKV